MWEKSNIMKAKQFSYEAYEKNVGVLCQEADNNEMSCRNIHKILV